MAETPQWAMRAAEEMAVRAAEREHMDQYHWHDWICRVAREIAEEYTQASWEASQAKQRKDEKEQGDAAG